jgi:hypothetical protein
MLVRVDVTAHNQKSGRSGMRWTSYVLGIAIGIIAATASARGDDTTPSPSPAQPLPPWVAGVTAEHKAAAQQHLDAGNALYLERKYAEALEEYKQALAAWNHPAIHFNMVRCLIFLERLLEASDELKLALQYGAAPFDETIYGEALAYAKLLASEIGEVEISCGQGGVQLTMDGQPLVACPGKESRRVMPGRHQIVGKKDGYVPRAVEIVVLGGKHEHETIALDPLSKVARIEHPWPTWIPWTVAGGGLVLAGLGELVHVKASSDMSAYANMVSRDCPDGCPTRMVDHSLQSNAKVENAIAITTISIGAAAIATGSVMLYLNRGHTVYDVGNESPTPRAARIDVVPLRSGGAVSVSGRF